MTSDRDKVGKGLAGGGTTGTGPAEPVSGVDRAAGEGQFGTEVLDDSELQEKEARRHGGAAERSAGGESTGGGGEQAGLSGGEASVNEAAGRGEKTPNSTGMRVSQSGRATSEGNAAASGPPDAGSPGGMGGARAHGTKDNRPPGGASPAEKDESKDR